MLMVVSKIARRSGLRVARSIISVCQGTVLDPEHSFSFALEKRKSVCLSSFSYRSSPRSDSEAWGGAELAVQELQECSSGGSYDLSPVRDDAVSARGSCSSSSDSHPLEASPSTSYDKARGFWSMLLSGRRALAINSASQTFLCGQPRMMNCATRHLELCQLQPPRRTMQTEAPTDEKKPKKAKRRAKKTEEKGIEIKPFPVEILIVKWRNVLEIKFDNCTRFTYPAELLRVESPSADSKRLTKTGEARVLSGRRHVCILGIEAVGNYALKVTFDDLHSTGIYTWAYLYELGEKKYERMRAYIRALKRNGLSRGPIRKEISRKTAQVADPAEGTT